MLLEQYYQTDPKTFHIKGSFGNVVLVMLFVFFENTCGWKSVWKIRI